MDMEAIGDDFFDPSQFEQDFGNFDDMLGRSGSGIDTITNQNSQPLIPANIIRDGKLFFTVSSIEESGFKKTSFPFPFCQRYYCNVTMEKLTHSILFNANHISDSKVISFDVFEYYGPLQFTFSVFSKDIFSSRLLGTRTVTLHDICLLQDKHEAKTKSTRLQLGWNDVESTSNDISPAQLCSNFYWGCEADLDINGPMYSSHGYSYIKKRPHLKIHFKARFVLLRKCLPESTFSPAPANGTGNTTCNEFHHAVSFGSIDTVKPIMNLLARKSLLRCALSHRTPTHLSILESAIRNRNRNVVKLLLQRAGNFCFQGTVLHSNCAIHNAVLANDVQILTTLLRFIGRYHASFIGWDGSLTELVNWRNDDDLTPLMLACQLGDAYCGCIEILLKLGADSSLQTAVTRRNAIMLAAQTGAVEVCMLLLSEPKLQSALHVVKGQQAVPLALLRCGAGECDIDGMQAISFAAKGGSTGIVSLLHSVGAPIDSVTKTGDTCMHLAARGGFSDTVQVLADIERRVWTAHCEANKCSSSISRMQFHSKTLLACNLQGKRPAQLAEEAGHAAVAAVIREACERIYGGSTNEDRSDVTASASAAAAAAVIACVDDDEADQLDYAFAVGGRQYAHLGRPLLTTGSGTSSEEEAIESCCRDASEGDITNQSAEGKSASGVFGIALGGGLCDLSSRLLTSSENKEKETYDIELIESHSHRIGV